MITHKPELLLGTKELTAIDNDKAQTIGGYYRSISDYDGYYNNELDRKSISSWLPGNQTYIDTLYVLVGYLYYYYELNRRFFDLLDCLAQNLERCYGKEIECLSVDVDKVQEIRTEMAEYLNKVALIFDIAANRLDATKEGGAALKATYELKAQIYSEKADGVLGVTKTETSRTARMLDLYQKVVSEFGPYGFLREPFLELVDLYQKKLVEEATSTFDATDDETARLLAATAAPAPVPRIASDGLLTKFWRLLPSCGRRRSQSAPARLEAASKRKTGDEAIELFADSLRQRHVSHEFSK